MKRHYPLSRNEFHPTVAVLGTDEVERISLKNGLLFHELLSPFATFENGMSFRGGGGQTLQLQNFNVQFIKAVDMAPRPLELCEKYLYEAFSIQEAEKDRVWSSNENGAVVQVTHRDEINAALLKYDRCMPWHHRFRRLLHQSLEFIEPELLQYPAVMIVAVASSNDFPIHCFQELSLSHHWPQAFQTGQYNAQDIPKVYVLLHDESEGPTREAVAEIFAQMKATFSAFPCKLLRINSLPPTQLNLAQADLWSSSSSMALNFNFFPEANDPKQRYPAAVNPTVKGCCLSSDDLLNLRDFVSELTNKLLLPALERRVLTLQASVAQSRKGVKNFVKSFWRKPRGAEEASSTTNLDGAPAGGGRGRTNSPAAVLYRHDRIESQIRLLADTSFIVQDYESALANYKLARDDFKSDKAWLHLGSVYEMMALCNYFLLDSSSSSSSLMDSGRYQRDMEGLLDEAVKAYLRYLEEDALSSSRSSGHSSLATRLATRVSYIGAEMLLLGSPPKAVDAANLLINAARKETALCAAILIEEASWAFLKGGNLRKFALYMSMAGQMFLSCQQQRHGLRCYLSSFSTYERSNWKEIIRHIHWTMGQEFKNLQELTLALYQFLSLLRSCGAGRRQSKDVQHLLVQDVLQICASDAQALSVVVPYLDTGAVSASTRILRKEEKAGDLHGPSTTAAPLLPHLNLPRVLEESLTVTQGTQQVEAQGDDREMKLELQRELKTAAMMGDKGASMRDWVQATERAVREERSSSSYSPSSSPYHLLPCRGRDEPIILSVDVLNPLQIDLLLTDVQIMAFYTDGSGGNTPVVSVQSLSDFQLGPEAKKRLVLQLHPHECGVLKITGLRWKLFGQIDVSMEWSSPGPLLQDSLEQRASNARGPNPLLISRIISQLPLLELEWEAAPGTLFQGEMIQCYLRVTNRGLAPAAHVYAKNNLPSWVFMRDPNLLASSSSSSSLARIGLLGGGVGAGAHDCICMSMVGVSGTVFRLLSGSLAPGATIRVPVWIRGLGGGKQHLKILVRYERGLEGSKSELDTEESHEFRYSEISKELCVLPSLSIIPSVSPSYANPGECIISLSIANCRTDDDGGWGGRIALDSVVSLSRLWRLEPLGGGGAKSNHPPSSSSSHMEWQERITIHYRLVPTAREGDLLICKHDLVSGELMTNVSAPPSKTDTASLSFDFLYIEHANQAYRTAQEEVRRRTWAAGGNSQKTGTGIGTTIKGGAPRSLQEIKKQEAERKKREDEMKTKSPEEQAERLGMGMEGSNKHGGHIATIVPRGKATLNLILTWLIQDGTEKARRGQHQIINHAIRPLTLDPTTAAPLTITVDYPPIVYGRYGPAGLLERCQVEVLVTVHNRMTDLSVDFVLEALAAPSGKRQSANKAASSSCFMWLGCTSKSVKGLSAGSSVTIPVSAAFLRPGIYDLNRFRFVVHIPATSSQLVPGIVGSKLKVLPGNKVRIPYIFSAQYIIKVLASAAEAEAEAGPIPPADVSKVGEEEVVVTIVERDEGRTDQQQQQQHWPQDGEGKQLPEEEQRTSLEDVDFLGHAKGETESLPPPVFPSRSPRDSTAAAALYLKEEEEDDLAAAVEVTAENTFDADGQDQIVQQMELEAPLSEAGEENEDAAAGEDIL